MTAYSARQHLRYTATQLFDLVADVERYPEFMSWVVESRIRARYDQAILVDMTIATGPLRKRFISTGVLHRPHQINISSHDPMFDRFEQRWTFEPASEGDTEVEFHVDFKFRSRVLQMLMAAAFAGRAAATMSAFKHQARRLYGARS